jgi:multicomponent Na+:H+ antiporter subunit D
LIVLVLFPILIPIAIAAACFSAWRWWRFQRALALAGAAAHLAASLWLLYVVSSRGIQVVQPGNWPAPFGISLVADLLAAMMVVITGLVGLAVAVYSPATVDVRREAFGYYPLLHVLLAGVSGSFLTGDLFNLYVWFEVMLIASFVLMALGGEPGQIEGAFKYVTINLLSSALFLAAVGLLYGSTGTLNMAHLAVKFRHAPPEQSSFFAMLLLSAFGIKAAVFPLFFWLPASYHTPPAAVSALFAGLLTKVGVYALIRVFTLIFVQDPALTHNLILVLAGFTMVTGVFGAMAQNDFRRILSFHIISQIGYMIMGLGLFTPLAVAASIFYVVHHIIVKTNLFLISGVVHRLSGSYDLPRLGGLYSTRPLLGVLFLLPALSLAGLPPLSGFFAKLFLIQAGLEAGSSFIVAVALIVSLLTLFSMMKIWAEVFWKPAPAATSGEEPRGTAGLWLPVMLLALVTVAIGAAVGPVFDLSRRAADQLMFPEAYIRAVLGGQT